jgi:predicted amidophosphoribosyltransferase
MMDFNVVLNIVLGSSLAIGGWFVRQIWDAVQKLKDDLKKIEVDIPTNYVRKDEMTARFDRIEDLLDKLYEKLDNKVDK